MSLLLPLITTGAQVLGNLYGQYQANQAQKKYDNFLTQRRNDLASKLSTSENQNYLDTASAKAALEQVRKNMAEATKATTNAAIQGGATPESVIATQGKLADKYQNAVGNLVNAGENIRQRNRYLYENVGMGLDNQQAASLANKVNQWGQFQSNVGNAASGIMNAWAQGAFTGNGTAAPKQGVFDPSKVLAGGEDEELPINIG
jgi:hypothetical protein